LRDEPTTHKTLRLIVAAPLAGVVGLICAAWAMKSNKLTMPGTTLQVD
jgi:hypothetical protein